MENVKKILGFDFNANAFARRAPQPLHISTQNRAMLNEIVEKHGDTEHKQPKQEELRQIYRLFIDSPPSKFRTEFDTLKRVRRLAWALTYSENHLPRIVDTPQLRDALGLIEARFRISALLGVFDALLQAWETTPNTEMLREFVKRHLSAYDGSRKFVQKLKANLAWYCEADGARTLARTLSSTEKRLSDVWSFLELPDYMHSYRYFGEVAQEYVSLNSHPSNAYVADVVAFVEQHNRDATSRDVLSTLIVQLGSDADENLRQPVQSYVLRKWQDPRMTGADVRWRGVSDEARAIFTRWITEKNIHFFFDVVAKACKDSKFEYRKAFWLAYLGETNSGCIDFCRLVLRSNAEYLFRDNKDYHEQKRSIATLKGGDSNQHAFIIQMRNHTFIEFSTNAACYVYENSNLPFRLDASTYTMATSSGEWNRLRNRLGSDDGEGNTLRNQRVQKHRVIHRNSEGYYWQDDFADWIKSNLGIEPLRSYRLAAENETAVQVATNSAAVPNGMVPIPRGEFLMGSSNGNFVEKPRHTVHVDAFYMDKYPVTNAQFKAFIDANPQWRKDQIPKKYADNYLSHWVGDQYPNGKGNHPVVFVSWYAAMAYAAWAGKRLPTEAEWEKAARGGLSGKSYPWGDDIDSSKANYGRNVGNTTSVGSYSANGYSLYDMVGNIYEWCIDEWDERFYSDSPRQNPIASAETIEWLSNHFTSVDNTFRVLRGGAWNSSASLVRVAYRYPNTPASTSSYYGFRCVRL